ncbi:unnamed protein product [Prunus armeniaca]|uniref:Uncharacterized protein n=1 Tax=Prunus armeniaca TaxID=36596 RepID=A0A6J5U5Y9_PRUAR|nr:unnamed protein product [Prunus armeniaca]
MEMRIRQESMRSVSNGKVASKRRVYVSWFCLVDPPNESLFVALKKVKIKIENKSPSRQQQHAVVQVQQASTTSLIPQSLGL